MSGHKAREGGKTPAADPTLNQLPQTFVVKYLGKRDARGLWGIKHTRRPVDSMVAAAKGSKGQPPLVLPLVKLTVSTDGVKLTGTNPSAAVSGDKKKRQTEVTVFHPIETISYGVQDLVYTRVFSMIIVRESEQIIGAGQNMQHPFQCHGFVCDSRNSARRLTYVLAAAFQEFSKLLKEEDEDKDKNSGCPGGQTKKRISFKKFAIDLRTPEQIEQDLKQPESEA
ncbi:low density lipoprotein receptor adapter protein 1 [Hetaerina americana]|uniref:low density lipoprotein receptor adapter protein 1 n=1 Tax=Hetaerina americana TaxID=62018 RepID=UPI003A7F1223